MSSYDKIADRWIGHALDPSVRLIGRGRSHHTSRMFPGPSGSFADRFGGQADALFSYGFHFELGRVLRDGRGKVRGVLLNGERASVTTTKHQGILERAVQRAGVPFVAVPYGALDAAGVVRDSVRILENRPAWTERIVTRVDFDPSTPPRTDTGDRELQVRLREAWDKASDLFDRRHGTAHWHQHAVKQACERWHMFAAARTETWDGGFKRVTFLHGYCYSCEQNASDVYGWSYPHSGDCQHEREPSYYTASGIGLEQDADGWFYVTHRHWLGESVIRADVRDRRTGKVRKGVRFLSGFDHNERRPSYFFCELPRPSRASTVAEAYDDLKPEAVKLAEGMGRSVERQGDIFAIATTLTDAEVKASARAIGSRHKRDGRMLGTNHTATRVAFMRDGTVYAKGSLYHIPDGRRNDHARCKLGDGSTWHLIVKNTVPVGRVAR